MTGFRADTMTTARFVAPDSLTKAERSVTPLSSRHRLGTEATERIVAPLRVLALNGLLQMFDIKQDLFCHRRTLTPDGMLREGISHRYTVITLLGLIEAVKSGMHLGSIDIQVVLSRLLRDLSWIGGIGDLGLLLWLCASESPDCVEALRSRIDVDRALHRYSDSTEGKTTELAWFLAGLAHAALVCKDRNQALRPLAFEAYNAIKRNQAPGGLFAHISRRTTLASITRGYIGCFADQVYPIYAFTRFGQIFDHRDALDSAKACAKRICELQGSNGQWWWHYNASTNKLFGRYPVFSVHQDGMAPMALLALSEVIGEDYSGPVYGGLHWITGKNELGLDLRNPNELVIWRSIDQQHRYAAYIAGALGRQVFPSITSKYKVVQECRPYHFGWLLYAFSRRQSQSKQPG